MDAEFISKNLNDFKKKVSPLLDAVEETLDTLKLLDHHVEDFFDIQDKAPFDCQEDSLDDYAKDIDMYVNNLKDNVELLEVKYLDFLKKIKDI